MDSITQAVLGGSIGATVLGRRLGRRAVLLGMAIATLPDLDVMLDAGDPIANYSEHRGITHSLLTLPPFAALCAVLAWWIGCRRSRGRDTPPIPLARWGWFFVLALVTHPLIDAFTTYGTQLLWPLAPPPTSWSSIAIIDPLYTLPLLVAVILVLCRGSRSLRAAPIALGLSTLYLGLALVLKGWVVSQVTPVLIEHRLQDRPMLVQPVMPTSLVWQLVISDGERYHQAYVSVFDRKDQIRFDTFSRGAQLEDAALATPGGRRLAWFAGPFIGYREDQGRLWASDLRVGMPGIEVFSFAIAQRDAEGEWQALATSQQAPMARPGSAQLSSLARRLFDDDALCAADNGGRTRLPSTLPQCATSE
ncbi:metal-dependent hydrolase [Halotalea alkalilenta]|uniref:metal-dependent hydrolase n=1 Tax=Halotalea alkalilenta TaxID=376489 RepID=UPI00069356B7|nr:metal-dependent hydrolase [Halotalea alkalilenta]